MLNSFVLPKYFWTEVVNTACYILNRIIIHPILKTPNEPFLGKISNISYFKVFGCKCFIFNTKDNLGKFDSKSDEHIFLGYSTSSKAYRVFNKRSLNVEESMHVNFNETNSHISKITKEVDISDSGDSGRIDPTSSVSDPTNRNFDSTNSEQTLDE